MEKLYEATENLPNEHKRVKAVIETATNDRNFQIHDLRDYAKFLNEDRGSNSENKENNKNFISKNKNNPNIGQINDRPNKPNRNIKRDFIQDY